MKSILLVEDDVSLGKTLAERLVAEGYSVNLCQKAQEAKRQLGGQGFDLIILDVGLPDGNGFELAKDIRRLTRAPFLFVTAQVSAEDRLRGYELGAEEYIPKPFHLKELLIRVKHVMEKHIVEQAICVEDVEIDFKAMFLKREGKTESLNAKEVSVLRLLIQCSPKVVSRDDILNEVWGRNEFPSNRTVDNIIVRLRQLLGERASLHLKSVRGVGYQWIQVLQNENETNKESM